MNKRHNLIVLLLGLFILSSFAVWADTYKSLTAALAEPEKVTKLYLGCCYEESTDPTEASEVDSTEPTVSTEIDAPEPAISDDLALKHLPSAFGSLIHLKELQIAGLEMLEDLPVEIGNLKELESIVIDNGNGSQMNISLPESIGNLTQLKTLVLYGAIDAHAFEGENAELAKVKELPQALGKLQNLEILDLGRNGLTELPSQVASLSSLTRLSLDYNAIRELPEFVGNLKHLKYLAINSNGGTELPESLKNLKALNISIGNASLKLEEQKDLRKRFPDAIFEFSNEFEDEIINEENPDATTDDQTTLTD
ncbi:MAG: hypothetical protein KKB51_03595 [Candidatus Riflebacteria bacterium]|nr:hypothetical protein [Candidatus Riflebacteria bacterium]